MSTENISENLREKFGRFRILIVGRANAGKTTILQRMCNTTENPEIYDGDGNKIDLSQVEGTRGRGIHNIENELVFRSNDKFVFHDSQGFEAGGEDEFLQMKKFIADRAKTTLLKKRIHAIWYCIPMDKLNRAIQRAEEMFFGECDPGNIPIVVLFTKFDALAPVALGKLAPADRRLPIQERLLKAVPLMEEIFDRADVWGRLSKMTYAPKSYVRIEGMHRSNEGCDSLLVNTAAVLHEETLQMLFVSAQETNIALCVNYAAREVVSNVEEVYKAATPIYNMGKKQLYKLVLWFPHIRKWESEGRWEVSEDGKEWHWHKGGEHRSFWEGHLDQDLVTYHQTSIGSKEVELLTSNNGRKFANWKQILQAGVDAILLLEHSFYLAQQKDPKPVFSALEKYNAFNIRAKVVTALEEVFKQYTKASQKEKVDMVLLVITQNRMGIDTPK